jgi:sn-glycerol 3-phosphate transport system permease protein
MINTRNPAAGWRPVLLYACLGLAALAVLFPLFFALSLALQGETVAPALLPDPARLDWGVFPAVFHQESLLGRWMLNSLVVALAITGGQIVVAILAAYPLACFRFKGRNFFFLVFLATLMIPWESTIIPNYLAIAGLHWKDSYQGLIVPFLASAFGIFLLRQGFLAVPRELHEAAQLEGSGRWHYLWSILVPLSRPSIATLAIYGFLNAWNQYYWPLLVVDAPAWRTAQVGITAFRSSEIASFNLQMAATLVVVLPTVLVLWIGQKQLVGGLTAGALKG